MKEGREGGGKVEWVGRWMDGWGSMGGRWMSREREGGRILSPAEVLIYHYFLNCPIRSDGFPRKWRPIILLRNHCCEPVHVTWNLESLSGDNLKIQLVLQPQGSLFSCVHSVVCYTSPYTNPGLLYFIFSEGVIAFPV